MRLDVEGLAAAFRPTTPVRWISAYLVLTDVGLAVAWIGQWAAFVFAGVEPAWTAVGLVALTLLLGHVREPTRDVPGPAPTR